jgi:hypothetical protein
MGEEELVERVRALAAEGKKPAEIRKALGLGLTRLYYLLGAAGIPVEWKPRPPPQRIHGVLIAPQDWERFRPIWERAADLVGRAVREARGDREGFGWAESEGMLVTVRLGPRGKLLQVELYTRTAEYVASELQREMKDESSP